MVLQVGQHTMEGGAGRENVRGENLLKEVVRSWARECTKKIHLGGTSRSEIGRVIVL